MSEAEEDTLQRIPLKQKVLINRAHIEIKKIEVATHLNEQHH